MQNKTTSSIVDSPPSHPLAGILGIKTIRERAKRLFVRDKTAAGFVDAACRLTERLFTGRFWSYQPIDLRYHDFLHTLQATQVYLDLAAAAKKHLPTNLKPSLRQFELGLAAILLHDTGYLKAIGDDEGTGAKYTHSHVLRSCALAASVAPALGCLRPEIDDLLGFIRSTGLNGNPADADFSDEPARLVASMVATADYLGQMAAPEYPAKLAYLFAEFEEADNYNGTPKDRRPFKSASALVAATPSFWANFVRPRLDNDFAGVHRLLASPHPHGANPYIDAIEHNVALIAASRHTATADHALA